MRDTYRRYLMTLAGTAIALLPYARPAAAEIAPTAAPDTPSALRQNIPQADTADPLPPTSGAIEPEVTPSAVAQTDMPSADLLPRIDLQQIPRASESATLSPAETPRPLEPTLSAQSSSPEVTPAAPLSPPAEATPDDTSLPLEEETAPETATPSLQDESRPATALPAATATSTAPEYLNPQPNPLLLPTTPEEVQIIGTQPITLDEAIELSYRNNEQLRVSLLELERSQAALREAQAALYPDLNLSTSLTSQESQSSGITPTGQLTTGSQLNTTLSGTVEVSYDLYNGGRRSARIRAAEERVRLQELDVEQQRAQLRLDTTNDYYALQESLESIRIAQAFLTEAERNRQDAALREEVGVGTRFDVLRAEVQVANARQELVQAQSNQRVSQRSLARRLNLPPSLDVSTVPVGLAGTWPLTLEQSIVLAFQNRAELEQQLVQRTISDQERQIALSATIPQVGLFANYSLQNTLNRSTGFVDNYSFGARLQWNLYDGGAAIAQAQQRERDIEIAESQFADTRNGVRLEVEQAYFNLVSNQENIGTAELAVTQAREALELAQLRFDAGVGTQLDVLSATRELTEAEGNLVQAILGYNRSLAALERAVSNVQGSTPGS